MRYLAVTAVGSLFAQAVDDNTNTGQGAQTIALVVDTEAGTVIARCSSTGSAITIADALNAPA